MGLLVITIFILAVLDPITSKYGFRAHRNLIKKLKKKRKKKNSHIFSKICYNKNVTYTVMLI